MAERGLALRRILRIWVRLALGPASVEDLAAEIGAQPRTVRRDLEQLRLAGAPVRAARLGRSITYRVLAAAPAVDPAPTRPTRPQTPATLSRATVDRLVAGYADGVTIATLARREGTRQSLVSRALRERGVTIRRGPRPR